jgi:hypothetical protein
MISATRRWLRRNRNGIAIGAAVVGGTYLAGQYVLGKINEARERMQMDRIAKEKYVDAGHGRAYTKLAFQYPKTIRTKPNRLHNHRFSLTTYSDGECYRGIAG